MSGCRPYRMRPESPAWKTPWPLTLQVHLLRATLLPRTRPTQACGSACQVLRLALSAPPTPASLSVHHKTYSVPCSSPGEGLRRHHPTRVAQATPQVASRGRRSEACGWAHLSSAFLGGRRSLQLPGSAGPTPPQMLSA